MYKTKTLLLVFVLLFFTLGMQIECRRKPTKKMVLDKCAKRMEIKFPPSTRVINFADGGFLDYAAHLKIEIDRNDLESFIANSAFAGEKLSTEERYTNLIWKKWWDASERAKNFRSGFIRLPRDGYAERLNVLIDLDSTGKPIIYLEFWSGVPIQW